VAIAFEQLDHLPDERLGAEKHGCWDFIEPQRSSRGKFAPVKASEMLKV
jgi:hypothetical protein